MKKWVKDLLLGLSLFAVVASAVVIGMVYVNFSSKRIYEDSTTHLAEVYSQVQRSFFSFSERNWALLKGWNDYIAIAGSDTDIADYIYGKTDYWGFSQFYFISKEGSCIAADGNPEDIDLESESYRLFSEKMPVLTGQTLADGQEVTLFAMPVAHSEYKGFGYDAVAVSYTNDDLSSSLNVDAFSGKARCFVLHSDGRVLLSTQSGGSVFANYLVYLKAASDISDGDLDEMQKHWENGETGVLQCKIGEDTHCLLYQPVGFQDYVLLSSVPQNVISAGFLSVQKMTTTVLLVIFLLIGITVTVLVLLRSYKLSRRNRTELMYRERMFDVLSNSVDDIFIMIDATNYGVDYISPNTERLLGIPVHEIREDIRVLEKCAVSLSIVIPKDELAEIPLNGSKYRECECMHQVTGERRWYRMTVYHMSIQNVRKYISVMSDRTLEQQMNQKLQEALNAAQSANEAKSNFLSNMSHDIRTPMNAIVGFSVLLEKDADRPDKVREYTRKITASSQHLLSLINDVLDMSKIESGKTSLNVDRFSLPQLLEDISIMIAPQAKAKGQEFLMHVQGTPPEQLLGDKLRLNQILINLLSNAVKYTQDGGKIDFTVTELQSPAQQYAKLRFTVRDNGIGMSEEFQKEVFAPFSREINSVTNKIQGTGLGMAITKNLVDLMGGIISVESEIGKGSTFTVELSFALPEPEEAEEWFRQKITRLLVADDEEEICLDIKELMSDTGVNVSYVTDGESAVREAVDAHNRGEDYHVILLDWKMPGVDGVEAARRIRAEIGASVPILVLTSYDWSEIEDEARSAGINAFMPKPFFASTFWQAIKPLFFEQVSPSASGDEPDGRVMEGLHFLVAEDNELNAEILTEMLEMEGATCELAVNGKIALEMFEKSEPGHFDMILMDVQMPVMNGYEATREIRACSHPEAKTIPIAAMTANTFAEDVRNALDSGMDGHLAKPINMTAVRALVGKLAGGKKSQKTEDGKE